jgi:hypothetical protein
MRGLQKTTQQDEVTKSEGTVSEDEINRNRITSQKIYQKLTVIKWFLWAWS